jgi:hypothetical protein
VLYTAEGVWDATCLGAKPPNAPYEAEDAPRPSLLGKEGGLKADGGGRAGRDGCGEGVDLRPGGGGRDMMNCCT